MKIPSIINPVAIAWKTLIDSLETVAATMIQILALMRHTHCLYSSDALQTF